MVPSLLQPSHKPVTKHQSIVGEEDSTTTVQQKKFDKGHAIPLDVHCACVYVFVFQKE